MPTTPSTGVDGSLLVEPLTIGDLLAGGSQFEINSNDIGRNNGGLSDDFFDEDFGAGSSDEDGLDVDPTLFISPWQQPYSKLKSQMIKINEHIYKKVIRPGNKDSILVPDRARVTIHYTSYAENSCETLDSTFLRGHAHTFHTGNGDVLPGIEQSVRTMKKNEESQFVISYQLLYGELGCPPRIKPKTDYLFVIQILNFDEIGDVDAMNAVTQEDRKKFEIVFPKVLDIHKKGKDFFKLKNYQGATKAFHTAVNALQFCKLKNISEQEEQRDMLIKLYTNLATIYSILDQPAKVCSMCNEMCQISPELFYRNAKALYRQGKAYSDLGEFKLARDKLVKAERLCRGNEDIANELEKLNERFHQHQKNEKSICEKAFGMIKINNDNQKDTENDKLDPFKIEMIESLESFKKIDMPELPLPDGLSVQELQFIEQLASDMGMKLTTSPINKKKMVTKMLKKN